MNATSLERRILLSIFGAAAVALPVAACRKEAVPAPEARAQAPSKVCTNPHEKEEEMCFAPFAPHPRAMGTGEPAPSPSASAYDADGCLPKEMVSSGCCNPGLDGPRKKDGKCCYTVCTGTCCGRPFLVAGTPRVAPVSLGSSSAWVGPIAAAGEIDPATAAALGDAWLRDAQMEHASAAAFGRFLLQLLALGAPADLVRRAALAAADEVHHAELCFGLAARWLGAAPSPAPLPLEGALDRRTLPEIVTDAVLEGCVGETIAALLAARQLEGARDAAVGPRSGGSSKTRHATPSSRGRSCAGRSRWAARMPESRLGSPSTECSHSSCRSCRRSIPRPGDAMAASRAARRPTSRRGDARGHPAVRGCPLSRVNQCRPDASKCAATRAPDSGWS